METRANYILIGFFTIIVGLSLLIFGLWAAKYSADRTWQNYRVIFDEAVTGLSVGSAVQYNGIAVGSITDLNLAQDDPRKVIARIHLNSTTPVKTDTRAKLAITSLTGPAIIQLSGGSPQTKWLVALDDSDEPIIQTSPSALQNITVTANHVVERLDQVLSDQNMANLSQTIDDIHQMTQALADHEHGIDSILRQTNQATRQFNITLANANQTLTHIDQNVVRQLPTTVHQLQLAMAKLDSAANHADGILSENRSAIQSFANDGLGQLGPTLNELRGLIRDLRQLSDRLQGNPSRYLLGRDAPKEFEPK